MLTLSTEELAVVAAVPLFKDELRRQAVLSRSRVRSLDAGEPVLVEGQHTASFFVVLDGLLEVSVAGAAGRPRVLGRLGAGDWFGEEAVIRRRPRSATVRTLSAARFIEVPRDVFESHVLTDPDAHRVLYHRAELRLAERSLRSLAFFAALDPDEEIDGVVARRSFAAGEVLFAADAPASTVGILLEGVARSGALRAGPGQCVAEQDVLRDGPWHTAEVMAETRGVLLEVRADRFRRWVEQTGDQPDWIGTLERTERGADGRPFTVYQAVIDGAACTVTVDGDPSQGAVVTVRDRAGS